MPQTFESPFAIGEEVKYTHDHYYGSAYDGYPKSGSVTAVRFTKAGVFYEILDHEDGQLTARKSTCVFEKDYKFPEQASPMYQPIENKQP